MSGRRRPPAWKQLVIWDATLRWRGPRQRHGFMALLAPFPSPSSPAPFPGRRCVLPESISAVHKPAFLECHFGLEPGESLGEGAGSAKFAPPLLT